MTGKPPKRAAATSAKAQHVAAIAAAEAKEAVPVKKPRGRPKKNPVKPEPIILEEEEEEEPEQEPDDAAASDQKGPIDVIIDWTNDLTWTLITAIESDPEMRDGLFPGVGAIKRTGGQPKTHYYYKLATICFDEHEAYKDAFTIDPAQSKRFRSQQRKLWTDKVKNRVNALIRKAKENIIEMGQTGAGITSEDEIRPGTSFATKWDLIQKDSPWFFNIRSLIASRPNLQPVGLGNNDSGFDVDLLLRTHDGDDTSSVPADDTQDLPSQLSEGADITSDSDDELLANPFAGSAKRKREDDADGDVNADAAPTSEDEKPAKRAPKKRGPQPATSIPATGATAAPKKPQNAKDKFSAVILAEEQTAQQELGLKRAKNETQKELTLAKIRAETEVQLAQTKARSDRKREKRAAKMDLMRLKMQQEHELRMAQMQSQAGPSSMSFSGRGRSSPYSFDGLSLPSSDFGDVSESFGDFDNDSFSR
ncbi:hypothetical protein K438DRAFT_2000279 [Mycena galopus ATCC 62051]|nr:hypothetical protein K438DRAFT_2000279 [Mycena galopus ATCC 62051]